MVYRVRSVEQSGWFLKNHDENAPGNAVGIQGKLRAGEVSFIDGARHFGRGALRGWDAYCAYRPDGVDARPNYRVGNNNNGVPTLFTTGSRAEFHWAELLVKLEVRIYRVGQKKAP